MPNYRTNRESIETIRARIAARYRADRNALRGIVAEAERQGCLVLPLNRYGGIVIVPPKG